MKKIILTILMIIVFVKSAAAIENKFNIVCELAPDVTFRVFTEKDEFTQKYSIFSGEYFQKVETSNPAYCEQMSELGQLINLNCEDQNSASFDYKLKFVKDYKEVGIFTIIRIYVESKEEEYKLCQSLD